MSATTASASAAAPRPARPWLTAVIVWALLLTVPLWLPMLGGYTALAGRVLVLGLAAMSFNLLLGFTGVMSFGHAAYFGLGAYGAGLTLKYVAASTPLAMLAGILLGGLAGTLFGLLIVRRRGVYFAMVTVAFGQIAFYIAYSWNDLTGGYDGLRGFSRAPLHLGFTTIDIANNDNAFYYFLLVVFAVATGVARPAARLAVRPHLAGDPRKRTAGPLPRHPDRAAYLAVVLDLLLLYRAGRRAVRPAEQLRRSDGPALLAVGRDRDHDGHGRHARLLGTAGRRRAVRRAAGLHFLDDRQLDVLRRPDFRPGRAVFPARPSRHAAARERRNDHAAMSADVTKTVRQPGRRRRRFDAGRGGRTARHHRPQRRRQDDVLQHDLRLLRAHRRRDRVRWHPVTKLAVTDRVAMGMARTFQITEIFPELTVRENIRIGVESAMGFRSRFWLGARHAAEVNRGIDEALAQTGLTAKADRLVGELSHGDQRAAEIATALTLKPRLLLLDEPTAGMGEHETYAVANLIRRLHKNSAYTIVLIEHDMRVVFNLADRSPCWARARCWRKARRRRSRTTRSCRKPIWEKPNERAGSRGAEHLLRQEPHPARCRPDRRRRPDHHIARTQWRRQDHHAAQPGRPDAATLRPGHVVRQRHHRPAAVPHRRLGRRLRPGRPPRLRQPDGGRKPARPDRAARSIRYRQSLSTVSRAWASAGRTSAGNCPAASRRCCRSAGPCC